MWVHQKGKRYHDKYQRWTETKIKKNKKLIKKKKKNDAMMAGIAVCFDWILREGFNIDDVLQPNTAEAIYEKANAVLAHKTPVQLLEDLNVEVVCTTDDPADDLQHHIGQGKILIAPMIKLTVVFGDGSRKDYKLDLSSMTSLRSLTNFPGKAVRSTGRNTPSFVM